MSGNLFYRYYDVLFQKKDYKSETELLFKLSTLYGIRAPKKLLEIGCGTGNHTQELAKRAVSLISIDIDENMIAVARKKIKQKHIRIRHTPIDQLREKNFDLAIALFNVVTYIPTIPKLLKFMDGVSNHLRPGGIFVFDCWNGIAVIKDPPNPKSNKLEDGEKEITYTLTTETDFFNQMATLTYDITTKHNRKTKSDRFSFNHTLWTPMEIRWALSAAGLKIMLCSPFMKIDKHATENDWKIMFVAKKP